MKELLTYILKEVKDNRLSKEMAVHLLKQVQPQTETSSSSFLHPLLHQNTSGLAGQQFSSIFTGDEFFLAHHTIQGQKILPGVAHLEMARSAVALSLEKDNQDFIHIKDITWIQPLIVAEKPLMVHVNLNAQEDGDIAFEIYSEDEGAAIIYSKGSLTLSNQNQDTILNLAALHAACSATILETEDCYTALGQLGMGYGPAFRGIEKVHVGNSEVLAKLVLPDLIAGTLPSFFLHPALLDSAIQAMIGLQTEYGKIRSHLQPKIPFALQELEVYGRCTSEMWALITTNENSTDSIQRLTVELCDTQGKLCVRFKNFAFRVLAGGLKAPVETERKGTLLFTPFEEEKNAVVQHSYDYSQHIVVLCAPEKGWREEVESKLNEVKIITLIAEKERIDERYEQYAIGLFEQIQHVLNSKTKGKILFQVVIADQTDIKLFGGLWALIKTAGMENPNLIGQFIEIRSHITDIAERLIENSFCPFDSRIIYKENKRWIINWSKLDKKAEKLPWKDSGVYLITGGTGALGLIFAREIAIKTKNSTLILTGRSALDEKKKLQLKELSELNITVVYKQLDVVNYQQVESCLDDVKREFGSLNGIIHSAGVIHDQYIIQKNAEEWIQVLRPKVTGVVNLDLATRNLPLDFFILFSSGSGATGNPGQADYATANAFMDTYSYYRNELVANQQRYGQTLSVNWPLWNDGGMQMDKVTAAMLKQNTGLEGMDTDQGIHALYQSFDLRSEQVIVMNGDVEKISEIFDHQNFKNNIPENSPPMKDIAKNTGLLPAEEIIEEKATEFFQNQIATFIKLPPHRIQIETPLEKYGVESIHMVQLITHLEETFGPLPKTLFFEYQSVKAISNYFLQNYKDKLIQLLHFPQQPAAIKIADSVTHVIPLVRRSVNSLVETKIEKKEERNKTEIIDIAVIGISGKYPQADNINQFWENLMKGRDCITEIPEDRWNHDLYFSSGKDKLGKTPCKWGGFLAEIDKFDPLFFNMSPREAAITDPQERVFLETVWNLFESSGYTRSSLQQDYSGKVGVYVGAMYQQYQLLSSNSPQESITSLSTHSSIANRVSYFFNLHGPSIAIDTACSSSIVALHSACESLRMGECKLAIAGGVNLTLHPKKYLGLSLVNLIGSAAESRSFSDGDGYLPSEGAGALLLKPLSEAIKDGDTILAVVKSTSINHNGYGNGFTAPNPSSQAKLIEENFSKAGISPRSVSYAEAAANGSFLGDPIEIAGLNKAFRKFTQDEQFCAIGSVKSNIGHAESASGISQLTKVILQLQHSQLVPSIKAVPLNPNINFEHTPFYLQQELEDWKRPVIQKDGKAHELPRRATVSAFGAGGTNGHVILEEYISSIDVNDQTVNEETQIIIFSAKTEERLKIVVQQMLQFIISQQHLNLVNLSYTLQNGREAMPSRLALLVSNQEELITGLTHFLDAEQTEKNGLNETLFIGNSEENHSGITSMLFGKSGKMLLDLAFSENNLEQLALYWTKGVEVPWRKLYEKKIVQRMVLPTYPFDKQRCWIEQQEVQPIHEITKGSTEDDIYELIINLSGMRKEDFNPGKPLEEYGFDSILFIQLVQQLQANVNPLIQINILRDCKTSKELKDVIQKFGNEFPASAQLTSGFFTKKNWPQFPELVLLNQGSGSLPVFWIHAGAGGVETYQQLAQQSSRPFYGIQARGYMTDRAPLHGIQAMAAYYSQIIQTVQPEGPYDLGGFSLGGIIAYEITRQLQEMNQTVNSIVMLDSLYGEEFKGENYHEKDAILQTVNMALSASIAQDPEKIVQTLISREQINSEMNHHEFMMQLIQLARKRGLAKTDNQLQSFVSQIIKVQRAYHSSDYIVVPLSHPADVSCYYFRNKSGLFLGEMAPYFLVDRDKTAFDHANYWKEWEEQFPDIHIMDMDIANHMMMLSDPGSVKTISSFCEKLYSGNKLTSKILKDFKVNTEKKHGKKNSLLITSMPG